MNLPSIHALRKAGFKIKIDHYRRVLFAGEPVVANPNRTDLHAVKVTRMAKKQRQFSYIDPKGGTTRLYIGNADGTQTYGVAVADCNARDRFNRRLGVRICIGRLVAKGVIPSTLPQPACAISATP